MHLLWTSRGIFNLFTSKFTPRSVALCVLELDGPCWSQCILLNIILEPRLCTWHSGISFLFFFFLVMSFSADPGAPSSVFSHRKNYFVVSYLQTVWSLTPPVLLVRGPGLDWTCRSPCTLLHPNRRGCCPCLFSHKSWPCLNAPRASILA